MSCKTSNSDQCSTCPNGWQSFTIDSKLQCLKFIGKVSYSAAESTCKANGGKLPLPVNSNENSDFEDAFSKIAPWETWITLGLSDVKTEGKWVDRNDQPLSYTNWAPGRPAAVGSQIGSHSTHTWDYASMYVQVNKGWKNKKGWASGTWSDYFSHWVGPTVCQLTCAAGKF